MLTLTASMQHSDAQTAANGIVTASGSVHSGQGAYAGVAVAPSGVCDEPEAKCADGAEQSWRQMLLATGNLFATADDLATIGDGLGTHLDPLSVRSFVLAPSSLPAERLDLDALIRVLRPLSALKSLDLQRCSLGTEGAAALATTLTACTGLQMLNLLGCGLGAKGDSGAVLLLECVAKVCTELRTLNLERNGLGSAACTSLGNVLQNCTNLSVLCLGYNSIGSKGLKILSKYVATCVGLRHLELWSNSIGQRPVLHLLKALQQNPVLTDVRGVDLCSVVAAAGLPIELASASNAAVLGYLAAQDQRHVRRYKLIVVGPQASGKTMLLWRMQHALYGEPPSTYGIEPSEWEVMCSIPPSFTFTCFDTSGDPAHFGAHSLFFSDNAVLVLVWDLSQPTAGVKRFLRWVRTLTKHAPIVLVGSFGDRAPHISTKSVFADLQASFGPLIGDDFVHVSNVTGGGTDAARDAICTAALSMPSPSPDAWEAATRLEPILKKIRTELHAAAKPPIILVPALLASVCNDQLNALIVLEGLRALHDWGRLIWIAKSGIGETDESKQESALSTAIILDVRWLARTLAAVPRLTSATTLTAVWPDEPPGIRQALLHACMLA